ncbi:MAG TPA: HlyD family efflux transporter periplasmic adaptor subunit [Chthoniobacteraceae bacterium]|jgi:putative peptide zinc metalloprotease protein|nr:HlyD family efflux transporter periplasmic adaptor subunit [Chthoniobacteraceae bacterium]
MTPPAENRSVREIDGLRPRLREGLRFSIQEHGGRRVCVIEDRAASRFHRVGLEEFRFLRSLDGTRTVAMLLAQLARAGERETWSEAEAAQILRWARDQHLLAVDSNRATPDREHTERALKAAATWLNPLTIKIPLGRPDRFFTRAAALLHPLLGWGGFALWLIVLLAGAAQLAPEWGRFTADASGLLARDNWLWLALAWTGLKVAHEFGHGLICKHFGAAVREVGAIFVLFVPMGYVDATASIGFASKWRRIAVSCAGMAVEFFLAGLAAVVWAHSEPGTVHTIAHNVVITGTMVTLLFNANPLMRFDGYFILSDLLELPNLATRGRQWMQRAWMAVLAGSRAGRTVRPRGREEWLIAAYGAASWVWQVLVLAGLLMGASVLLRGGGLALAAVAAIAWLALPLARFGTALATEVGHAGRWLKVAARLAVLAGATAAVVLVPWERSVSAPGIVEMAEALPLRADCPGFVETVRVRDGQEVAAGDLLVSLRNDEAAAQLTRARLDLMQQELRARLAYTREDVAAFQSEEAKAESLRRTVAEKSTYLKTLEIRAPFAGRVTNRRLANLSGTWFSAGQEVLRIGQAGADVKLAVSEGDAAWFRGSLGKAAEVRVDGRGAAGRATLIRMEGRATREITEPALTAIAGGPLPLRRAEEPETAKREPAPTEGYELAEPRFTATARLAEGAGLFAGETAWVRFKAVRPMSLWLQMDTQVRRWLGKFTPVES